MFAPLSADLLYGWSLGQLSTLVHQPQHYVDVVGLDGVHEGRHPVGVGQVDVGGLPGADIVTESYF